jgi:hypothetical protein
MSHVFDRKWILDWYDAPVEALVHCSHFDAWFYSWLIAWAPESQRRTYAFRLVPDALFQRIVSLLGEPGSNLEYVPEREERWSSLQAELFAEPGTELLVAEAANLCAEDLVLQSVSPKTLGRWAIPRDLEQIVDQPDEERTRLHRLAEKPRA